MRFVKNAGPITVNGVIEYEPELRFTYTGKSLCSFQIIDTQTKEIQSCEAWEEIGEAIIEQDLKQGAFIILNGYHKLREYKGASHDYFIVKTWEHERIV